MEPKAAVFASVQDGYEIKVVLTCIYQNSSHNCVRCVVYKLYLTGKFLKREQDGGSKTFEILCLWKYLYLPTHW